MTGRSSLPKKVSVEFEGVVHCFRLVPHYTFADLLVDAVKHWILDVEDFELQDDDGSTWPASGSIFSPLSGLLVLC